MNIPFLSFKTTNSDIKSQIIDSFECFFDSGWYVLGENVKKFEKEYAAFNKVHNCIGVSNGLDALHICLKTLGLGPGDEIIIPSNTYIATVLAVSYIGAVPVLVEPKIDTYNIDAEQIERAITTKTKAIMPVHLYGQACEMHSIMALANKYNLYVIEDNAQSQGASYNEKYTGSWGDINATSFYPGKNLGALGDAGAITTNNHVLAQKAAVLRNYGSEKKYHNELIGFNMRLDECQAGFLSIKLKYLEKWTKQRQQVAHWYDNYLPNIQELIMPTIAIGATHVYHLYVIRTPKRDELQRYLLSKGIDTLIHYPIPPHLQKAYTSLGYAEGSFPIAETISNTCLSLPLWPGMTEDEVIYVAEMIKLFYDGK